MTRIGPWIFAAGLALLCAGIVSSTSEVWKKQERDYAFPVDMDGVRVLEIGKAQVGRIVLGGPGKPGLRFSQPAWDQSELPADPVAWTRDGDVLRLDTLREARIGHDSVLRAPSDLERLSGDNLTIEAETAASALRVDASSTIWKGDVAALDVRLRPRLVSCGDRRQRRTSAFEFKQGAVQSLHISMEAGTVTLGDLSRVGDIELRAGDDVRLDVRHIADLAKIRVLPFDGPPSVDAPSTEDDAADQFGSPAAAAAFAAACAAQNVDS